MRNTLGLLLNWPLFAVIELPFHPLMDLHSLDAKYVPCGHCVHWFDEMLKNIMGILALNA
jgi:hypothetical protein